MRPPARDDRGPPHRYDTARVEVHCPTTAAHEGYLILEQATIYPDGWARWVEDGHEIFGYIQAGRCCDAPAVSAL